MAADPRAVLETALAQVERGEKGDNYLRDAVRSAIVLLGGDTFVEVEEPELEEEPVDFTNDLWDGTGRRVGW